MSRLIALALTLVSATAAAQETTTRVYRNVTIQRGDGSEPIPDGSIVIRGEELVYAGPTAGAPAAAGAETVELEEGAVATPGLVAVGAPLGLVEISLEDGTRDAQPEEDDADPVRAAFAAAEGYNPDSTLIPVTRLGGITHAVSTPTGGLVSGVSAYVHLGEAREADEIAGAVVSPAAALHVDLGESGIEAADGAMPTALTRFREVLEDARLYGQQQRAYDRRALREMRVSRLDLQRLQPALAGDVPVVVHVSRAADILRVLALAEEFGLDLVLGGAEEAWRVAEAIADADVPVIVQPLTNLPSTFRRLGSRYDNAKLLHDAGVTLLLATSGAHDLRNLRQEAGNAVRFGLPAAVALQAVTATPAALFGPRERGTPPHTLTGGARADVVIWSGDPFEMSTRPLHVLVGGEPQPLTSRQTELRDRYRQLPPR
jgi:imidazolonepropionase-like amidohydrolase